MESSTTTFELITLKNKNQIVKRRIHVISLY